MDIQRLPVVIGGDKVYSGVGRFAKGTKVVGARGLILLSGSVGIDMNTGAIPEGAGEQAKLAMENIKARLEEFGGSLGDIVFLRRYVKGEFPNGMVNDPKFQEADKAIQDFWKENYPEFVRGNRPPASCLVGVTSFALAELFIEIEVTAAVE